MSVADIIGSLREFNRSHRTPTGHARGSKNGRAVLIEEEVRQIKRMTAMGIRPKIIMKRFPRLTYRNYWYIAAGKHWTHV